MRESANRNRSRVPIFTPPQPTSEVFKTSEVYKIKWLSAIGACVVLLCWSAASAPGQPPDREPEAGTPAESLPDRVIDRFGTMKLRHSSRIASLSLSASGRYVAAGGGNDPVRIWDVKTGELRRTIVKENGINTVAFSYNDSVLATAGSSKKIRLWDTATGIERRVLDAKEPVKVLAFSADGTLLASGEQNGMVRLWGMDMYQLLATLEGHSDEVAALAFSPDGKRLASAGCDRSVRLWDTEKHELVKQIDGGCSVAGLAFSGDGKTLISAGDDNLIRLWDAATGKAGKVLKGHEDVIVSLQMAREGSTLASGGWDRTIRLWNLDDQTPGRVIPCVAGDCDALSLSKNGKLLAYAGVNGTIHLVDTQTGKERFANLGAAAPISALALSRPDGKTLVALGEDGNLNLWDVSEVKLEQTIKAGTCDSLSLARVRAGHVEYLKKKVGEKIDASDPLVVVTSADDGLSYAAIHRSGTISVGYQGGSKLVGLDLRFAGKPNLLAFAPDGKSLAAAGQNKAVVWELPSGKVLCQIDTGDGPATAQPAIACLALSRDGATLALGCFDALVRLYDVKTGKGAGKCEGHERAVLALAYSRDGRMIATGSDDHTVRTWEAYSGRQIDVFHGHRSPVQSICFAGDGRSLFSGSAGTSILHWDVTGISNDAALPTMVLNKPDLEATWKKLVGDDTGQAYLGVWELAASARESLPFLEKQLYLVDPKHIDQLFADLNNDHFEAREKASFEIAKIGIWMRGRLTTAISNPGSDEMRVRVEKLLEKVNDPKAPSLDEERLRIRRVIMVLEQIGSPAATRVLQKIAGGAPEPFLQEDARSALDRLAKAEK